MNNSSRPFKSSWWFAEIPRGWVTVEDAECVTFRANPPLGVLQVSSGRKDKVDVTDEDLEAMAKEQLGPEAPLMKVSYRSLSGFLAEYRKEGLFWKEWWLRFGPLMLYVTYNVALGGEDLEKDKVETVLNSLRSLL